LENNQSDNSGGELVLKAGLIIRDNYRLEKEIGEGSMGEVWKATDLIQADGKSRNPFVAIKFWSQDFKQHPDALKVMVREFHRYEMLLHPNIVRAYLLDRIDNTVFIVMEFLQGIPLKEWIKKHPNGIPLEEAKHIILNMANALSYAHKEGLVHLDFKPANVFYETEQKIAKVIDFGIARLLDKEERDKTLFDPGSLDALTDAYASYEMLSNSKDPAQRDDIYGLACVTYKLLSGKHPFGNKDAQEAKNQNLSPDPIEGLNNEQNEALLRGLAFDRKDRTPTVDEFLADLDLFPKKKPSNPVAVDVASNSRFQKSPSTKEKPCTKDNKDKKTWFWSFVGVVVLVAAIVGITIYLWPKPFFRDPLKDGGHGPEMAIIPKGSFQSGDKNGDTDEWPVHDVSIKSFAMCRYEVTFEEYDRFADATDRDKPKDEGWGRGKRPVINVSWDDAKDYVEWLSKQTGKPYGLPSEAQWEYAARANTTTKYWWGDTASHEYANYESEKTSPVGSFAPNPFGLYDTVGNVWEWVDDPYHDNYKDAPKDGSVWIKEGDGAVLRGGSWYNKAESGRAANRLYSEEYKQADKLIGFRCIRYPAPDVSRRLRDCDRHFQAGRLISDKGGNAFKCYNDVLKKDPTNARALEGLKKIKADYVTKIEDAFLGKQWDEAKRYLKDLRLVNPASLDELEKRYVSELKDAFFLEQRDEAKWYLENLRLLNPKSSELAKLETLYVTKIENALKPKQLDKAKLYLEDLRLINPKSAKLPELEELLKKLEEELANECTSQHSTSKFFQHCLKDGGLGPKMVTIPAGDFWMGDIQGGGETDEKPKHFVSIKKSFAMCRYEVTFEEYDRFADATGRDKPKDKGWGRGKRPVINVSWDDAKAYVDWLSEQTDESYGLPSEAQWEYAARAGKTTKYWWGDTASHKYANYGSEKWTEKWSGGLKTGKDKWKNTSPVGSFEPNPFGLYDMVGNVWEWVADPYHDNYNGAPKDGSVWKKDGGKAVLRGGSWYNKAEWCRVANRYHYLEDEPHDEHIGFRCSLKLE